MKIFSFLSKKANALCFSLLCGISYLGIISKFVMQNTETGGGLLIFFFAPAIVAGGALLIFKAIDTYIKAESKAPLNIMFWGHIIVFILSVLMVIEAFIV